MDELKPNSHKYREEQKQKSDRKIEKVVTGKVKRKKKSELYNIFDLLLPGDLRNVKEHLIHDVLKPRIYDTIVDMVTDGINLWAYGDTKKKKKSNGVYVNYSDRFAEENNKSRHTLERRGRYSVDDIEIDSRGEAEDVIDQMKDILDRYKIVTVGDLYELVGEPSEPTDFKYGWMSLNTADIIRTREGYMLKLPRPMPID